MLIRRTLWVFIGFLTIGVLAGGGFLGYLLWQRSITQPLGLLVVRDSQLRLIDAQGERVLANNVDADQFRYPATSPDGRSVVYIATEDGTMTLRRLNLMNGERQDLYRSSVNQPFNMAWSPDGRYVNFLLASPSGLSVHIVPGDGSEPAELIGAASTSFYAWKHDSSELLIHMNGHVVEGGYLDSYRPAQGRSQPIVTNPGFFQAPAWSVDGQSFYYVAQPPIASAQPGLSDITSQIVRVNADGSGAQTLATEQQAAVRLVRSPVRDDLAYVSAKLERTGLTWGALKLITNGSNEPRQISRPDEQVSAFFWSPDGQSIAYLSHQGEFDPQGSRTLHVIDVQTGTISDYGSFQPNSSFVGLQTFFDAYLYSFSPWSPDSRQLAYSAEDGVYVLDLASGSSKRASEGELGMWIGGR